MSRQSSNTDSAFLVFRDPDSLRVFWGQLISQSCDKLSTVGLIWILTTMYSAKWIPLYIALGAVPHFVLAMKSGHLISRWGALRTVVWTDISRGVLFLAAAGLVPYAGAGTELLLVILFVSTFLSNIAGALFNPAILTLPILIMEAGPNRDKLTALIDSCFSWGNVLGPLLSAIAFQICGLMGLMLINGLSYLFSGFLALGVKTKDLSVITSRSAPVNPEETARTAECETAAPVAEGASDETITEAAAKAATNAVVETVAKEGVETTTEAATVPPKVTDSDGMEETASKETDNFLRAPKGSEKFELNKLNEQEPSVRNDPEHRPRTLGELVRTQPVIAAMLFTFLFMNFFLAPLMIFMPWYAKNVYGGGISDLAQLELFLGIGTVAGGIILSVLNLPGKTWMKVSVGLFLMAISYMAFTYAGSVWLGSVAVLFLGFFLAISNVVCLTFFQSTPEPMDVPVVMGLVNLISVASLPISMGVLGSCIELIPVKTFALGCSLVVIFIALFIPLIPGIKSVP